MKSLERTIPKTQMENRWLTVVCTCRFVLTQESNDKEMYETLALRRILWTRDKYKKFPFTDNVLITCRILSRMCYSAKISRENILCRDYFQFVKKYQRYEKIHLNIPTHISPCLRSRNGIMLS